MKIKTQYKLLLFILFVSIQINSQNISLNNNQTTLKTTLIKIEQQTKYKFVYNDNIINSNRIIDISINNLPIKDALNALLKNTSLTYKIIGNQIAISKSKIVQSKEISGVVNDNNGASLPGITVLIEGTSKGVSTDFDGNFSIMVEVGQTLVFSSIGLETYKYKITRDSKILKIVLKESATSLDEVVLTAFGEETKKEVITGAIENIDIKTIENSAEASIQGSLQGNATGVQVISSSGSAGSTPNVRIRGVGSIEASGFPIYVVDGVILDPQAAASISSDDVETVSVLKDAAATSIYGTKGANGVILIKTKSGKDGKIKYRVSVQSGIAIPASLGKTRPLNTKEFQGLLQEGLLNNPTLLTDLNLPLTIEGANQYLNTQTNFNSNNFTDWYNVVLREALFKKVTFSASGGTKKNKFFLSTGYQKTEGIVNTNDFERIYARLKLTRELSKKITIIPSLFISKREYNRLGSGGSSYNPLRSLHRTRPDLDPNSEGFIENSSNPFTIFDEYSNNTEDFNFIGSLDFNYNINDTWSIKSLYSTTLKFSDQKTVLPVSAGTFDPLLTISKRNQKDIDNSLRSYIRYKNKFGRHKINTFLGFEFINEVANTTFSLNEKSLPGIDQVQGNFPTSFFTTKFETFNVSTFLNSEYNYRSKYFLSASIRRDGSSRFGKNNKFGTFWSVGTRWNIHKEDFMDNVRFIDRLSLRASYGLNGQDRIGSYPSLGLYSDSNYAGNLGLIVSQIPNPNLKWEVNKPLDIGINFTLFDNKFSGAIDWYTRETSDLIIDFPVSSTNVQDQIKKNIGGITNTGIEVSFNTKIINSNFKWIVSGTYTKNRNEVTRLDDNLKVIGSTTIIDKGLPLGTFFLPGYAGVDPQNGDALWYKDGSKTSTTNIYSEAKRFIQGDTNPDFYGSITNSFSYKGFKLSTQFYSSWGGKVYDLAGRFLQSDGSAGLNSTSTNVPRNYFENRWQNPGDNARYPKYVYLNNQSGRSNQVSSRFLHDGSYVRLRDVTFSYSINKELLKPLKLTYFNIYFKGNNLWTYVKDPFLQSDPEAGISGTLNQRTPIAATYTIGVTARF